MDYKIIENKWQKYWDEHPELSKAENDSEKPKKYVLVEFPYPSGSGLHVGHAFSFTGGDVYARFMRMKGHNVLFPMGWDAFGLPTENYAIKMKRKPQEVTRENTDMFRSQMKRLAFSFDWSREVNTTDPEYYKWTQWIFVKLFEKGLAYKQEMPINWCPSCKIGLANEEVVDGKCERCGAEVSRRNISQWVVKITEYADRLIEGLKDTDFIDKVKMAQVNWIGKSEGARVKFKIKNPLSAVADISLEKGDLKAPLPQGGVAEGRGGFEELEVFTTRPDTLYGVTFMVISPEHELVGELAKTNEVVRMYVEQAKKKSELERAELQKDKTGVDTGIRMINPANGQEVPLWVADYVLMNYGTGVVMGVPGHDQRDWDFAKKYNLGIVQVIRNGDGGVEKGAMTSVDEGEMINSEGLNGLPVKEAIEKMKTWIEEKEVGQKTAMYHLRDWIFSRQHYWGEPIPMIFCENCAKNQKQEARDKKQEENMNAGWVSVPEEQLPIKLPEVEAYEPTDDGLSPLSRIPEFVNCTCPKCGGVAKRETDTMPNWAGSDWYFLRYCDPHNQSKLADFDILKKWSPVDVYIGGDEHNTLHLLYSRFIHQFLYDLGVVPTPEPYQKRTSHGVILGPDNQRMSKSKGNVIVPETVADKYGVDVVRMYMMFMGPFDGTMAWNEKTLMGVKRFLERLEKFINEQIDNKFASKEDNSLLINKTIKGVEEDLNNFGYNTAIAKLMECLNGLKGANKNEVETLIKLMAPLAPYLAEELWASCAKATEGYVSVHAQSWPKFDESKLTGGSVQIPVAVNGKVRDQMVITNDKLQMADEIIEKAKSLEKIRPWIEGRTIVKEIYVTGKMINFVINEN